LETLQLILTGLGVLCVISVLTLLVLLYLAVVNAIERHTGTSVSMTWGSALQAVHLSLTVYTQLFRHSPVDALVFLPALAVYDVEHVLELLTVPFEQMIRDGGIDVRGDWDDE
jgi:hypothetical protein